jgi:uncharacterized protein YaaW (UPF0174 family)
MATGFSVIHQQVLNTLKSSTLAAMEDYEIEVMLNDMIIRSVGEFRFPKIALTYVERDDDNETVEYEFVNTLTQREINVILALVKKAWIEQQLDNESNFENTYYDKDVRLHSRGNLVKALQDRYELAKTEAERVQYDYYRVAEGQPAVKDIYGE